MQELEQLVYQNVRLNPLFPAFKKAIEEFKDYQFAPTAPYVKIRRKDDHDAKYTLQITDTPQGFGGRCLCKSFVTRRESVCKHIFICVFRMVKKAVKEIAVNNWSEQLKIVVKDDFEALVRVPGIDTTQLRTIYDALTDDEPEEDSAVTKVDSTPSFEKAAKIVAEKYNAGVEKRVEESRALPEDDIDEFVEDIEIVVDDKPKALVKSTKAFGGTIKDIPKNLVVILGGKPYVTKSGLIFAASHMGLQSISTKPVVWSWDNKDKRAVFHATVTFQDGRKFSSYGIAIPDGENIKMKQMWPFVDHFAETRAVARALRNALAFREPSVEEMPEHKEVFT